MPDSTAIPVQAYDSVAPTSAATVLSSPTAELDTSSSKSFVSAQTLHTPAAFTTCDTADSHSHAADAADPALRQTHELPHSASARSPAAALRVTTPLLHLASMGLDTPKPNGHPHTAGNALTDVQKQFLQPMSAQLDSMSGNHPMPEPRPTPSEDSASLTEAMGGAVQEFMLTHDFAEFTSEVQVGYSAAPTLLTHHFLVQFVM